MIKSELHGDMQINKMIHEHENISITNTGASAANVGHALLLGAQAAALAVAKEPEWNEETFDYKNKVGFETGLIYGVAKSVFNGEDFATLQILTGAKAD